MRKHWIWIVVLMLVGVVGWATWAISAGPVTSKLSAAELAKVKNGEVVLKNVIDPQTNKGYGSGFCLYHGTKDQFWKVIFDYEHYLDIYPRLKKVTVISRTSNKAVVDFQMDASLTTLNYTTINLLSADQTKLTWTTDMTRPHKYFKRNDGYWLLEEIGPGLIVAEYRVEVELDLGILSNVVGKIVQSMSRDDLPDVMISTRKRMESGGTWKRPGR